MPEVRLMQRKHTIECQEGTNLYSLLSAEGLMEGPCGGRGTCGKCRVAVDGVERLSCTYQVYHNIEVWIPQQAEVGDIVAKGYMKPFTRDIQEGYGIAVDIGTTTVVESLYDLALGEEVCSLSCLNSQKIFGQDVISRIHYVMDHAEGLFDLQAAIAGDLQKLTEQLCSRAGIITGLVRKMVVAGNTTMIHLLLGRDPSSLAAAPYRPAFTGPQQIDPNELGLTIDGLVECIPAIASYVGGDITAGIMACGIDRTGPLTFFLDIGTNGEMVLAGKGMMYSCSCAAGPALEGMNISCGMRAAQGAIEQVWMEDGQIRFRTIGNVEPRGICGSGLLSAIAVLHQEGVITSSGRFAKGPLVERGPAGTCVRLAPGRDIYLTQKDVRQVQLAKGAILSGILTLLEAAGRREEEIERVVVAGQFGAHLTTESLIHSGLLPQRWAGKIQYAGNTSKSGAAVCLLSRAEQDRCQVLAHEVDYIELSLREGYEKLFVECLSF